MHPLPTVGDLPLMGPLDMRGFVGAATIMGCLKHGASFSGLDDQDDPVLLFRLKDEDLLEAPMILPSCKVLDSPVPE